MAAGWSLPGIGTNVSMTMIPVQIEEKPTIQKMMMPTSELVKLYGYARMIEAQLKKEPYETYFTQAAFYAEKLSVWLEEALRRAKQDNEKEKIHEMAS